MTESHVPPSGFTPGADLTLRIAVKNAPADLKVTLKYHTSATEPYILSPCSFVNGAYQATIRTDSFGRNPLYYIFDLSWTGAGGSALTKRATAQSWQDFTVASTAAETTYRVPDVALQTAAEVEAEYAAIQPGAPAAPGFFLGQGKLTTVKIIPKKKFPGWHYYFAYASGGKKDFRFIELTAPFYEQPEKVVSWDGVAVFMKLKDPSTRYYFLAQKDSGGRTYTVEYRDMSGAAVEIWTDTPDPEPETVSSHAPETRKPAPELKNTVTVEFPKTFQWNKPFRFGVKLQPKKKLTFIHLSYRLAGEDTFRGELIDIDKRSFDIVIPAEFTRVDRIEYYYSLIEGSREAIVNDSGKPFAAVVSDPPAQTPSVNTSMIADYFEGSATTGKTPFLFETRDLPAGFVPHVVMVRHGLSETEFPMTEQRPGSWVYVHTMPKNVGIDSSLGYYYVIRDAAGRLKYRLPEKGLMMNLFRKNSLRPFIPAEKNTQ